MCDENIIERKYIVKDKKECEITVFYDKNQDNKLVGISDEKYRKIFEENNFLSEFRYIGASKKIANIEIILNAEHNGYLMSETYDCNYLIEFEDESLNILTHFPPVYDYDIGCEEIYEINDGEKNEFKLDNMVLKHYFDGLVDFKSFLASLNPGDVETFDDEGFYFKISFISKEEFYPV